MIPFEDVRPVALGRSVLSPDNLYTLYQACQKVAGLPGQIAEVGVYKGGSSKIMAKCLPEKTVWMFDTFEGIPGFCGQDAGVGHETGDFACARDEVAAYMAEGGMENYIIVPGCFPDSALEYLENDYALAEEKFCLVHLDADTYEPTLAGLQFFWDLLIVGGKILIHDYDWQATPGVKPAVEAFLALLPEGAALTEVIAVPGSIKYFQFIKMSEADLLDDLEEDVEEVEVEEMREVEVCRGAADGGENVWEKVESLVDVKEGDIFHMREPDETGFGENQIATCDGYLGENDVPTIECEKAIEPRAENETAPLTEGETPEGVTAEPVAVEDLKPAETIADLDDPKTEQPKSGIEALADGIDLTKGKGSKTSEDTGMKRKKKTE